MLRKMPMRAGDNEEKAARDAIKMFSGPQQEVPGPQRFQRAEGGVMTTMTDEPSPQKESPLTFEELRARLPMEVTDSVIRLLSSSEAALLDFANINTEQDIAVFNQNITQIYNYRHRRSNVSIFDSIKGGFTYEALTGRENQSQL